MKVLYLLDSLGVGGAERSLLEIARRLRGVEAVFFHLFPEDALAEEYRAAGIRVESLGVRSKRGLPGALWRLAKRLRAERPDLLQITGFYAGFVGRFAGRWAGVPIVDTFTNESYTPAHFAATPERSRWKLRLARRLDRRTLGWVRAVISVSEGVRDANCRALGISPERVRVIHRGRDPELFRAPPPEVLDKLRRSLALPERGPVLVNVSRLIPRKGQEDLIRALPLLGERLGSPVRLLLVGEGHHRPALEARAHELGVESQVRFLGRRRDVPALLHLADVFVFPSRFEGHPGSLVEAMLAARPVVASDIPVHRETLVDGETGWLVTPGEIEALAARIAELLEDAPFAARIGQAAREDATRRFAIDRIAEDTRAVYGEILGSSS